MKSDSESESDFVRAEEGLRSLEVRAQVLLSEEHSRDSQERARIDVLVLDAKYKELRTDENDQTEVITFDARQIWSYCLARVGAVVLALVKDLIMPIIGLAIPGLGNLATFKIPIPSTTLDSQGNPPAGYARANPRVSKRT